VAEGKRIKVRVNKGNGKSVSLQCYGTDKTTQKSGYGELTRKVPPLKKGEGGGFKISPKPLFTKEGNEHPVC